LSLLVCAANAQQTEAGRKKMPQLTNDDLGQGRLPQVNPSLPPSTSLPAGGAMPESIALLPASDLIAVIDVGRVYSALMPTLATMAPDDLLKMTRALDELTSKTGIDLTKIQSAVIGVRIPEGNSKHATGVVIVQGIELDQAKLKAASSASKGDLKTFTHQGKTLFIVSQLKSKAKVNLGKGAPNMDEMAFAQLDQSAVVIGDVASVESVLASAGQNLSNASLSAALTGTNPGGWVRFAATLPESLRKELRGENESFKAFAAINVVSGSLSFDSGDIVAAIDLNLHTSSPAEAAQVETSLKGLVFMGKSFFGGDKDPQTQVINRTLDQIMITAQDTRVAVSIYLPKELIEMFNQRKAPTATPQ
jgi:hypothetical protein